MLGASIVGLRTDEREEEFDERTVAFMCPGDLRKYIKQQARNRKDTKDKDVIIGALRLDKALEDALSDDAPRIKAWAASQDLDLVDDFHEVIVGLVRLGLESADKKTRK